MEEDRRNFSQEVQDFLGRSPSWTLFVTPTIILFVLLFLIAASLFISYPEKLPAEILLTTSSPPITVVSGSNGELDEIFVENNELLKKGKILAVINSAANYKDVFELKEWLTNESPNDVSTLSTERMRFGDLAPLAFQYLDSRKKLSLFRKVALYDKQQKTLAIRMVGYRQLENQQGEQCQLLARELELANQEFQRSTKLHQENVLSDQEFGLDEKENIVAKKALIVCEQEVSKTRIEIASTQMRIEEIELEANNELEILKQTIEQNAETLKSAIVQWEEKYLLTSNISGRVSFDQHWTGGQYVVQGQTLFKVEPEMSDLVGQLKVGLLNSGRIKEGQDVQIKLDNFPYEQYGMLIGRIKSLNSLPTDKFYLIDIELPSGLRSTLGKTLEFHQQMSGHADIVTEDLTLFDRLFYQFRKLYN